MRIELTKIFDFSITVSLLAAVGPSVESADQALKTSPIASSIPVLPESLKIASSLS